MAGIFNNNERVVEGWYWALRSDALLRGRAAAVNLMGRELAVYRGDDGTVVALDAYCPHMGAHLGAGRVEGSSLRCLFHYWKYDAQGRCTEIPSLGGCPPVAVTTKSWPVEEKYDLIWVWTGERPRYPVPSVPELRDVPYRAQLGKPFTKACHPHVVLVNAIDEHHFNSVHSLPVPLAMETRVLDESTIRFSNTTRADALGTSGWLLQRFYKDRLTYSLTYWNGSIGIVTLGPDRLHFYIMFALRAGRNGQAEGQTILVTHRRRGLVGLLIDRLLLFLTQVVGNYFAKGDTRIFSTIRFDFKTPVRPDRVILNFIQHVNQQPAVAWTGEPKTTQPDRIVERVPDPAHV